jgi:hypothetical protein
MGWLAPNGAGYLTMMRMHSLTIIFYQKSESDMESEWNGANHFWAHA